MPCAAAPWAAASCSAFRRRGPNCHVSSKTSHHPIRTSGVQPLTIVAKEGAGDISQRSSRVWTAVAEVDDAVAECARFEELEVDTGVVGEEGFASAESHRVDEQVVLVDQLVRRESRGQVCAAHGDRPAVLFLERSNGLNRIGTGEARVSLDCLERLREDQLRQLLPDPRELHLGYVELGNVRERQGVAFFGGLPEGHYLVEATSE